MSERLEQARQLGQRIDAAWQREDIEAQLARLHARQRVRGRRLLAAPLAAAAIAAVVAVIVVGRRAAAPPAAGHAPEAAYAESRGRRAEPVAVAAATAAPAVAPPAPGPVVAAHGGREHGALAGEPRAAAIAAREPAAPVVHAESPVVPAPPSAWRDDAERGDYAAAWAGLARVQGALDGMADLLLAGDVARLSGHAAAAVAALARAVALHADDPRAPLAAFTLGRVHLEDLGAPRDAALAFARARQLAPDGPLAEDALAREVEAWSRAGETATARSQAVMYTRRYPDGRRVHAVRRFGGLEHP